MYNKNSVPTAQKTNLKVKNNRLILLREIITNIVIIIWNTWQNEWNNAEIWNIKGGGKYSVLRL